MDSWSSWCSSDIASCWERRGREQGKGEGEGEGELLGLQCAQRTASYLQECCSPDLWESRCEGCIQHGKKGCVIATATTLLPQLVHGLDRCVVSRQRGEKHTTLLLFISSLTDLLFQRGRFEGLLWSGWRCMFIHVHVYT